ncbi:MAG: hemerythrin family protein [Betaproteobacteria bacterium]
MTKEYNAADDLLLLDPLMWIGVPLIDLEHLSLLSQLNRMIDNPDELLGSQEFIDVLTGMGGELSAHFYNEEQLLASCGMPESDVEQHLHAHTEILEQYAELNFDLMEAKPLNRADVLRMIRDWINGHTILYDIKIREYFPTSQ